MKGQALKTTYAISHIHCFCLQPLKNVKAILKGYTKTGCGPGLALSLLIPAIGRYPYFAKCSLPAGPKHTHHIVLFQQTVVCPFEERLRERFTHTFDVITRSFLKGT